MKILVIIGTLLMASVSSATETQTDCSAINNAREVSSKIKDSSSNITKTNSTRSH